jgi:hypothetical protein
LFGSIPPFLSEVKRLRLGKEKKSLLTSIAEHIRKCSSVLFTTLVLLKIYVHENHSEDCRP